MTDPVFDSRRVVSPFAEFVSVEIVFRGKTYGQKTPIDPFFITDANKFGHALDTITSSVIKQVLDAQGGQF